MSDIKNVLGDIWGAAPEDLQSKQSGVFGLNTGYLTKLEFNEKAGKDGTDGNAIDITVLIKDKEYFNRFFINDSIYNNKNEMVGPADEGYIPAFKETYGQMGAVVKHALKSVGVTDAQFDAVPRTAVEKIEDLVPAFIADVKNFIGLLPAEFQKKQIDVFLEYQWNIPEGKDRTYLTLPKNMKGGYFLLPHVEPVGGKWQEVRNAEGMHYVDGAGNKHGFEKGDGYMNSNKAIQQGAGATQTQANNNTTPPAAQAKASAWE